MMEFVFLFLIMRVYFYLFLIVLPPYFELYFSVKILSLNKIFLN